MFHQISVGESVEFEDEEYGMVLDIREENRENLRDQLMKTEELMEEQVAINRQQMQQLEH